MKNVSSGCITSFFREVSRSEHALNIQISAAEFDLEQLRSKRALEAALLELKEKRAKHCEQLSADVTILESEALVRERIDEATSGIAEGEACPPKTWAPRPFEWPIIAKYAERFGNKVAYKDFPDAFLGCTEAAKSMRLKRWRNDVAKKKMKACFHPPAYGSKVDAELLVEFEKRRACGLSMDNTVLRYILLAILHREGLNHLLEEHGGKHTFGPSWAQRFYLRHNITCRVCTTKMREPPADFEAKADEYMKIGACLIKEFNVPKALVVGGDETSAVYVNRAKRTRSKKGEKRVRVIGVGNDKAQITVTLFCNEEGDMLDYQCIWAGTTNQCHPKAPKPVGCHWTHTSSHWQSEETYLALVKAVITPYRVATAARLGLPEDQKIILKHDLHFSHLGADLLLYCSENHIKLLYVPAKCTDLLQECDVALNGPFKAALRRTFRDWLHTNFDTHLAEGKEAHAWNPALSYGQLKPLFPSWIEEAVSSLRTEDMKATIADCFRFAGRFELMRSEEQQGLAQDRIAARPAAQPLLILTPEENRDEADDLICEEALERELNFQIGGVVISIDDIEEEDIIEPIVRANGKRQVRRPAHLE